MHGFFEVVFAIFLVILATISGLGILIVLGRMAEAILWGWQ